jgi:ABC-2 type transport system permease protein
MRSQLSLLVAGILLPLVLIVFIKPIFRHSLVAGEGYDNVNGAEQAVPGMAVMSGFFLVGIVAFGFLREHGFGTWDRLRATPAKPSEIMVGKLVPYLGLAVLQQAAVFAAGALFFDLHLSGSLVALILVSMALACCLVAIGVMTVALTSTMQQVTIIQNLGAMLWAGVGGAFASVAMLPTWIAAWSPVVPSYWAMRGYRSVILDGGDIGEVALPIGVLLAFAAGCFVITALRFRFEESKPYWM